MTFNRILVPTDFSDDARAAADLALAIADRDGAELLLLHISELPDYAFMAVEPIYLPQKAWQYLWDRESRHIDNELAALENHLRERGTGAVQMSRKYRRSNVVDGINNVAIETDCDLIVIGSQGEDASMRYLFGGHAPKIARDAPCPVLVVRHGASSAAPQHALVAVDYSKFSAPATALALRLIGPQGRLTCCHVWQQPPLLGVEPYAEFANAIEAARGAEAQRMNQFVDELELGERCSERVVDVGSPARRIIEAAHQRNADVIVVGAHGRTGFERVIGTVADRVLRHADLPVLMLPERALREVGRAP